MTKDSITWIDSAYPDTVHTNTWKEFIEIINPTYFGKLPEELE